MNTFKHIATLALILAAAGCSGNQTPQPAVFVPPAESSSDFGDLRVHYNALPTASLGDAVAREYGVQKDPGTGMMVVALRKLSDGTEVATQWPLLLTRIDLDQIERRLGLPLLDLVLEDRNAPRAQSIRAQMLPPERHRGYALQWFGLSLTLLIIYCVLAWRAFRAARAR